MKRLSALILIMILLIGTVCMAETDAPQPHKIGVLGYRITDEEVLSFREYLENYIEMLDDRAFFDGLDGKDNG